ncbi:MAG: hypothetical protein ACJ8CB_35550 [Ktedonobacteraceae bacterium]
MGNWGGAVGPSIQMVCFAGSDVTAMIDPVTGEVDRSAALTFT